MMDGGRGQVNVALAGAETKLGLLHSGVRHGQG